MLGGFHSCHHVFQIEIPVSVEVIDLMAFCGCESLHAVVCAPDSRIRDIQGFSGCKSLSRIEMDSGSPIANLPFFRENQKCLVFRKMSKEWLILFEICSGCHMIDEPLFDVAEISERAREAELVSVDNQTVKISKISDRLICLYLSRLIKIPSFIKSIGSCLRWIEIRIANLVIPSFIEEVDGFYGFVSIEVVSFAIGSCVREIRGFFCCDSLRRIEIPASAELLSGFRSCDSLTDIVFENVSHVLEIKAFDDCKSLSEIEIPASVEILQGFNACLKLTTIMFASNCCLRVIDGFDHCSIVSIEIPPSVEIIKGFGHSLLSQYIISKGTKIKRIEVRDIFYLKQPPGRVFVVYDEDDLRKSRRGLNVV
jgi:hypothetical protein